MVMVCSIKRAIEREISQVRGAKRYPIAIFEKQIDVPCADVILAKALGEISRCDFGEEFPLEISWTAIRVGYHCVLGIGEIESRESVDDAG